MDFSVTSQFLFLLVSNPHEETDWEVKSYDLNNNLAPRFNLALLEPPPRPDVTLNSPNTEPKDFYFDLIFNKSSFSAGTIYNALSVSLPTFNKFCRDISNYLSLIKLFFCRRSKPPRASQRQRMIGKEPSSMP
jgi:hypothetical protein